MIDESSVRAVLNTVVDPCSVVAGVAAGIDEMGLVRHLEVLEGPDGAIIRVTIGVTEPGCLMGVPFAKEAQKRLQALPGVTSVEVTLDHALDWTPEDMSPEYQARLGAFRAARRAALGIRLMRRDEIARAGHSRLRSDS
jgi:metal-sulfur cluster biosynthetic enzyme